MQNEKKYSIPLDAQLDINSNDMLVPASEPKWSFNRQRLLGSVLQNSVRYEADGWFAGWWVHNFNLVQLGTVNIQPSTIGFPSLQDKIIPGQLQKKYWIVNFPDVGLQFKFAPQGWSVWTAGSGSVTRISDSTVRIVGTTTAGSAFTAEIDAYTGEVISFTSADPDIEATSYISGGVYNLNVSKPYTFGNDMIYLRWGSNLLIDSVVCNYSYNGTVHKWGNILQVVGDTLSLISTDYELVEYELISAGNVDEYFNTHLQAVGTFILSGEVQGKLVGGYDRFLGFGRKDTYDNNWVDDYNTTNVTGHDKTSLEEPFAVSYDPAIIDPTESYEASFKAGWFFPIWLKIAQQYNIGFEADIYDRHILPPSGDTVNSWFECILYMKISRKKRESDLQHVVKNMPIEWEFEVDGRIFTDEDISEDETDPLYIQLTPDKTDSRQLQLVWPVLFRPRNKSEDPEFPLPFDYLYATAGVTMTAQIPAWKNLPPPPPPWNPVKPSLWETLYPDIDAPADWANPYTYPMTWPGMPPGWNDKPTPESPDPPPWPPNWAFGVDSLPGDMWSPYATIDYSTYLAQNKPANWPIPWSGVPWPVPYDGNTPPAEWTPDWPINWPFGITEEPYAWYSQGTSYLQYITNHFPYMPAAADLATGGDPGYVWPGQLPYVWQWPPEIPTSLRPTYVLQGDPPWPYELPDGYTLVYAYNPNTGAVTFNTTRPDTWPDHVTAIFQSVGVFTLSLLGEDVTTPPYNYEVLNRDVVLPNDRNIFIVDSETKYQDMTLVDITFPICLRAYTYYEVYTVDVTLNLDGRAVVEAWDIRLLSNQDMEVRVFRLDTNNLQPGSEYYSLNTVTPNVLIVQQAMIGDPTIKSNVYIPYTMMIGYENTNKVVFDKPIDYRWPERQTGVDVNPLTDLQLQIPKKYIAEYGFYPEWIAPSFGGKNYWRTYDGFDQPVQLVHTVTVMVKYFMWFSGMRDGFKLTYTPETDLNRKLALPLQNSKFETINDTGRENPWAPGVFDETILVTFDTDNNDTVEVTYNVKDQTETVAFNPDPPVPWDADSTVTFTHEMQPREKHEMIITLYRKFDIWVEVKRAFVISKSGLMDPASITAATASLITLTSGYGTVDTDGLYKNHPNVELLMTERETGAIKIHVTKQNKADVQFVPEGIFERNQEEVTFVSVSGQTLVFDYNGTRYTLTIGNDVTTRLQFTVTDIRDSGIRELASLDTSGIMMAVKQMWSGDVDIENFWWIDSSHIFALTKYEAILYQKTNQLHDWDGDRWEVQKKGNRGNFFNNLDAYYAVSSAFGRQPVLFKIRNEGTGLRIFVINNIIGTDFLKPAWTDTFVPVTVMDYSGGASPSRNAITPIVPVDINEMLYSGKISATAVGSKLMIGLAVSRGMLQWTVIFPLPSLSGFTVVTGYGHVGHKGDLTGVAIPERDCDAGGFKGTIYPVAMFKDAGDDNAVEGADEKIFASGSSLWFVYSEFTGCVSHLECNNGTHTPKVIPLRGNYHCKSSRSAHGGCVLMDSIPRPLGLVDFIGLTGSADNPAAGALGYFSAFAFPSVWYIQPTMVAAVLSAQGMQQIAYVNRTGLPPPSEDGKSDKDVCVKRQQQVLTMVIDLGKFGSLVTIIMGMLGSLVFGDSGGDSFKVDASKDSNTVDDTKGRRLSQFATQAIMDGIATNITSKGMVHTVKTKATEIIALSMFHSISDGSECWAGPGFVNHNFIGQVVSQGVSAVRFKLDKYGAYMPLRPITELLAKGQLMVAKMAAKLVHDVFDSPGGTAGGGLFVQLPVMWVASAIAQGIVAVVDFNVQLQEYLIETIPALYDIVGNTFRGYTSGGVERNTVDTEATHVYGNKPMSMFWPAFGVDAEHRNNITVERVESDIIWEPVPLELAGSIICTLIMPIKDSPDNNFEENHHLFEVSSGGFSFEGKLYLPRTTTTATNAIAQLPERMACVEGIVNMLPTDGELKNLQVNCANFTFPPPPIHDYVVSQKFNIGVQAANGEIISYSMDDTKLIDGPASNIVESGSFFGIASAYTALEIKDTYDHNYLRPWAITPTCIALNINGINCVQMAQAYHGFDGQFNRIVSWKGGSGLDSCTMVQQYCLIVNDHFKRSNIIPPSEFFGKFSGPPTINITTKGRDRVATQIMDMALQKGLDINIPGEDRDLNRYALPIHSELLSTLPATVRMLAPYKLHVVEGITSLTTDVRNTQTKYKAPSSVDFNIYDSMFRATEEYIAVLKLEMGVVAVEDKVPSAGLTFIGATTKQAFFYSPATRMYYEFSGAGDVSKRDIFNRFKNIRDGRWDFVNQEVVFKCLLNDNILKDDVSGNFVARLDGNSVLGEIYPPNATIYNERSDFKILSMAGGLVYQGPKRCIVNRFVVTDDMYQQIKQNKRRWKKLEREVWQPGRDYNWQYDDWHTNEPIGAVHGWSHNPWRAATAMLGESEETDSLFEWELTFAWTEQVDKIFEQNEFISFNVAGETISQGGTLLSRPTHIFLFKELFKSGYYTMRYNAKNGMGNRERLYMWGDGMVALESLSLYMKEMTTRRMQPLATSQVDVMELTEQ